MPKSDVQIRRSRMTDAESLCDAVNAVAGEKWWLATADGFTPEEVLDSAQTYRVIGDHRLRFTSGDFTTEIDVDEEGYVVRYPGLAERA